MLIPREYKWVRIYCQLKAVEIEGNGRFDRSKVTQDMIFRTAQQIMKTYKLRYEHCDWWTVYQVSLE